MEQDFIANTTVLQNLNAKKKYAIFYINNPYKKGLSHYRGGYNGITQRVSNFPKSRNNFYF